jgi:hypothetical protein
MSAPKEVTELVAKWRERSDDFYTSTASAKLLDQCADELEAALAATPAVDAPMKCKSCGSDSVSVTVFGPMCRMCTSSDIEKSATPAVDTTAPVWVDAETRGTMKGVLMGADNLNWDVVRALYARLHVAGEVQGD